MNAPSTAIGLYLDLLKRSLTNTLFEPEPQDNGESRERFLHQFVQHYVRGGAISMLPLARFNNVQACVLDVLEKNVPGDLIETGVWRGGSTIFMRAILAACGDTTRQVWVADSFEGLQQPNAELYPLEAKAHAGPFMKKGTNFFAAGLEEVKKNFEAYGMLDGRVRFLQGWFKDTLPVAPIEKLAVLRLDGDYYESTMDSLTHLYDKVSVGGYIIVDDYGEDEWTYCRKATEDFRSRHGITDELIKVDARCYYWQRSR